MLILPTLNWAWRRIVSPHFTLQRQVVRAAQVHICFNVSKKKEERSRDAVLLKIRINATDDPAVVYFTTSHLKSTRNHFPCDFYALRAIRV